jgi:multidrug efflux pump subunit AcrB
VQFSSNFSAPFIRRPVATSLISLAILLAGAIAFRFLPVAPLPQVDFPTISVYANLPGASPETMASAVATPLERQFSRIASVSQMVSTSQLGNLNITLQFDQRRTRPTSCRPPRPARLLEGESRRFADHASVHDIRQRLVAGNLR